MNPNTNTILLHWNAMEFEKILPLLPPLDRLGKMDPHLAQNTISLYAKIYIRLAQQSTRYIKPALSLGLTAIENRGEVGKQTLMEILQHLIQTAQSQLPQQEAKELIGFWEGEKDAIQFLKAKVLSSQQQSIPIYTPTVAEQTGTSKSIRTFLSPSLVIGQEDAAIGFPIIARYSPYRLALDALKNHDPLAAFDLAFKKIHVPHFSDESKEAQSILNLCRHLILFKAGLHRIISNDLRGKKYVLEARPLLEKFPNYLDELIHLASSSDSFSKVPVALAETIEALSTFIKTPGFLKVAASLMCHRASEFFFDGRMSAVSAKKIATKALDLDPECEGALTFLEDLDSNTVVDQVGACIKNGRFAEAATIAENSSSPLVHEAFLQMAEYNKDLIENDLRKGGNQEMTYLRTKFEELNSAIVRVKSTF